jgi:APA family basic amino acid/polyamine antiporter
LFSSDAWNNVTFIAGEIKEPKEYTTKFISGYFDCHRYLYPGKFAYLALLPMHGTPGASDIAVTESCLQVMIVRCCSGGYDYG